MSQDMQDVSIDTGTPPAPAARDAILDAVVAGRDRPAPAGAAGAALTFAWRAMLTIKHVPEQLFDVTLTPVMFTLMFTYLFGGAIAGSTGDYLQYLVPGVLVMSVVFTTVYSGVNLCTDISKGVFDRFRSLPIWRPAPIVGALLGDTARYTLAGLVTVAVGLVLGFRPEGGVPGVVAAIALLLVFCFGLAWAFTLMGLVMKTPSAMLNMGFMLLFPLTFASNVFVRPDTMPSWLQAAVELNPITLLVTAVRELMGGRTPSAEIGWVLLASAVLTAVFAPLTMRRYSTRE